MKEDSPGKHKQKVDTTGSWKMVLHLWNHGILSDGRSFEVLILGFPVAESKNH